MFEVTDAYYVASILGVDFTKFTPRDFLEGINVEYRI